MRHIRWNEYSVLLYRIGLCFLFFFITRALFAYYNKDILHLDSLSTFFKLSFFGLSFDATAILYVNSLFILLSVIPYKRAARHAYQSKISFAYFIPNFLALALNCIDIAYYRYTYVRSGVSIFESLVNEENKLLLTKNFIVNFWHIFLWFFALCWIWMYLYKKYRVKHAFLDPWKPYRNSSIVFVFVSIFFTIWGIRGDFKKTTRPKNLVDANKNLSHVAHADVVLNTPFVFLRTLGKSSFKKQNWTTDEEIETWVKPIKHYKDVPEKKLNVVIIILESFGREYIGAFNQNKNIPHYESFTPFLDSLAQHSLIFDNAFSNGSKSIHGMSSVIAGVPSFKDAFTSSPYPNQPIQSIVSVLKERNYRTSFFHGAPNGSMGFQSFAHTLGYDAYYGMAEYGNDKDFDGTWAIWDEPFFQFMKNNLDTIQQPFMSTIFTATSHEPYKIPDSYKDKFTHGHNQMHPCVQYTDHALKLFFKEAAKSPWFQNTLFVITADHGNQVHFDEYKKLVNRNAIPILFYQPNSKLKGVNSEWAQQIDIYPTITHYLGYQKPFRSWGRSLLDSKSTKPFVLNYTGNQYLVMRDDFIATFDGQKITGVFRKTDLALEENLIYEQTDVKEQSEIFAKAFLQNYFNSIIERRLNPEKSN